MPHRLADELFKSLRNLEEAIAQTKRIVEEQQEARPDVVERLRCYEEVLRKQKILADALVRHITDQNWDQVRRHVELIRGSSVLIQLDSESMVATMNSTPETHNRGEFHD